MRTLQHEIRFKNAAIAQAYKVSFEKANPQFQYTVKRNVLSFQAKDNPAIDAMLVRVATYKGYVSRISIYQD